VGLFVVIYTIDFETYSELDVGDVGAEVYAEHPSTDIIVLSYGWPGEPIKVWTPNMEPPWDLIGHVAAGGTVEAHNMGFEHAIWNHVCVPNYGWPPLVIEQERDTQAMAAERGLPLKLEKTAQALGLPDQKDMEGHRLMLKFSRPAKPTKKLPGGRLTPSPEELHRIANYCTRDVKVEQQLSARLGHRLQAIEEPVWQLDQTINMRGVQIDTEAAQAAADMVDRILTEVNAEFRVITGVNYTQRDKFKAWAEDLGVLLPDTKGDTIDAVLGGAEGWMDPEAMRALQLHRRASHASNNKLKAMLRCTCADGRARRLLQYHGATTGRWAGRLIQPQNFPRPEGPFEGFDQSDIDQAMDIIATGDPELIELVYGDPLWVLSKMLRAFMMAAPGHLICSADLAGIENRVVAALGGERWKLDAFRRIDRGEDRDIYLQTADTVFGYRCESKKTHPMERQVGKICELQFGFGGGLGAWRQFDSSDRHSDEDVEGYKQAWRAKHAGIVQLWADLERAAIQAVRQPGCPIDCGAVTWGMGREWLSCRLPSGRRLFYFSPQIKTEPAPWDPTVDLPRLTFMQQREGQWKRISTYGGRLTENVVQAICRDIMVAGAFNAEAAGLPCILTVHDELVTEPEASRADADTLVQCMTDVPQWVKDLDVPIAADGWVGRRYWK
jgi:DNA polymerase